MIALIGCSRTKLSTPSPARELYTGALFRKSVAVAESRGLRWAVLSAKHGVVLPDAIVAPYNETLAKMPKRQRLAWAESTHRDLHRIFPGESFLILAGENYALACAPWCAACRSSKAWLRDEKPLARMGIGLQLQWLTSQLVTEAAAHG